MPSITMSSFAQIFAMLCMLTCTALIFSIWRQIRDQQKEANLPPFKFKVAVHEAGHAIAILKGGQTKGVVKKITTVSNAQTAGVVTFTLTGSPLILNWENVVVALGGAAGEFVGRGEIDADGLGPDLESALRYSALILAEGWKPSTYTPMYDVASLHKSAVGDNERDVLNFFFNEAVGRVRRHDKHFYALVNALLERRELTGSQIKEVLSGV